ncbi:MAG: rod shape-determining protein MreD [Lachnospiraceae bacterium]|nr:rod shape-determining protein MreD [Lachnospiraceae bacterium]MBQ9561860.1 rod shape-determining protein MreD [Lachnospiraceae bacterium]
MIFVIALILTGAALFLQSTVFPYLSLAGVVPNLVLACVVCFSYQRGHKFGMGLGFAAGLLSDLLFSNIIGLEALILMIVAFACALLEKMEFQRAFYFSIVMIGLADLLYGFLYYLFHFLLQGETGFGSYFPLVILPEVFYTVACGFLLYVLIRAICRWYRRFEFREE